MSTEEPEAWGEPEHKERPKDPAHRNRQIRGVHALKGASGLKSVRDLKGVRGLKSARDLKGTRDLKGAQGLKGAHDLKGAQDLAGTGTQHTKLQAGLKVIQEVVKDELQGNVQKLKDNMIHASETMKNNLQAGIQSTLQTGANAMQESRSKETNGMHDQKETEKISPGSHEISKETEDGVERKKNRPQDILINLVSDSKHRDELIDKLVQNIILAKNTLDKTVAAIDVVQDVLDKSAPLLGEQESIKKLQEILNKLEPRIKTAKDVMDKIEPLLSTQRDASTIRDVLEKFTGSVDNLHEHLNNAKEKVDALQAILHRIAVVFKGLDKAAPLVDKEAEVGTAHNLLNKVSAIVKTVETVLGKTTTSVDAIQATLDKIIALPGKHVESTREVEADKEAKTKPEPETKTEEKPEPETEKEAKKELTPEVKTEEKPEARTGKKAKKEPAAEAKAEEKPESKTAQPGPSDGKKAEAEKKTSKAEDKMLDSLKKANIINPDVQIDDLHKEIENLRLNLPSEAGIIGYPGHMLFVWKEEEEEEK